MEVQKEGQHGYANAYRESGQLPGLVLKGTEQSAVLVLLNAHKELQKVYKPSGKEKTTREQIHDTREPPAHGEAVETEYAAVQA